MVGYDLSHYLTSAHMPTLTNDQWLSPDQELTNTVSLLRSLWCVSPTKVYHTREVSDSSDTDSSQPELGPATLPELKLCLRQLWAVSEAEQG